MMPCTRLRKSLQVGQAQRTNREKRKGTETEKHLDKTYTGQKYQTNPPSARLNLFGHITWWPKVNKWRA